MSVPTLNGLRPHHVPAGGPQRSQAEPRPALLLPPTPPDPTRPSLSATLPLPYRTTATNGQKTDTGGPSDREPLSTTQPQFPHPLCTSNPRRTSRRLLLCSLSLLFFRVQERERERERETVMGEMESAAYGGATHLDLLCSPKAYYIRSEPLGAVLRYIRLGSLI